MIDEIKKQFKANSNHIDRKYMINYMKRKFDFYGIKAPIRKTISKPFLKDSKILIKPEIIEIIKELWNADERELQYLAIEIAVPFFKKNSNEGDISFFEELITDKSWWDTVDLMATKLVGNFFIKYPEKRKEYCLKWLKSNNIWLVRSAILFQLKYKEKVDLDLLFYVLKSSFGSNEFFINKAIGWSLREISKKTPEIVSNFIANHNQSMSNLSIREASKYLK